jgi:H+-transporting ATPase
MVCLCCLQPGTARGSFRDQFLTGVKPEDFGIFANILPEGKYNLVKAFQKAGRTVGMCGDGANDAPALRQAQIGIAVSTATDVAKSAAGVVLTEAGLGGIVSAVKEGRITFQRILTYTLNSVLKKIVQVLLLAIGLVMTGHAVLTPTLMVIVMITGDFLAMSLTTDRVRTSAMPNLWQIGKITRAGVILGGCFLAFCVAVLAFGKYELRLGVDALRTLSVVAIVYGSQATIYAIRERRHLWGLRPTLWLVLSSVADLLIISALAIRGIAMAPLPISILACEFAAAMVFGLLLDGVKNPCFLLVCESRRNTGNDRGATFDLARDALLRFAELTVRLVAGACGAVDLFNAIAGTRSDAF